MITLGSERVKRRRMKTNPEEEAVHKSLTFTLDAFRGNFFRPCVHAVVHVVRELIDRRRVAPAEHLAGD